MSARDELAALIESGYAGDDSDCPYEHAPSIADAILAAGYTKPRTIATAEELHALPVRSVLLTYGNKFGPLAVQKLSTDEPAGLDYFSVGLAMPYSATEIHLPATVLHDPEAAA